MRLLLGSAVGFVVGTFGAAAVLRALARFVYGHWDVGLFGGVLIIVGALVGGLLCAVAAGIAAEDG